MKKTLTAAAVGAMLTPFAAMADAQLYSRIALGLDFSDQDEGSIGNQSSRFGIRASRDIGGGNKVIGRYEWGVDAAKADITDGNTDSPKTARRLSYVGFSGGWGNLEFGTVWSPYFNFAGAKGCDPFTLACNSDMTFRLTESITYNGTFGGFGVGALAQFNDGVARTQFGVSFDIAGFGVAAAIDDVDGGETTTGIALTYDIAGIGLKYLMTNLDTADDTQHAVTAVYSNGPHKITGEFWTADSNSEDIAMVGYLWTGIPKTQLGVAYQNFAKDSDVTGEPADEGIVRLYLRHDF